MILNGNDELSKQELEKLIKLLKLNIKAEVDNEEKEKIKENFDSLNIYF